MPDFTRLIDICVHKLSEPNASLVVVLPISRYRLDVVHGVMGEFQKKYPQMILQESNGEKLIFANGPDDKRRMMTIVRQRELTARGLFSPDTDLVVWRKMGLVYYFGPVDPEEVECHPY